MNRISSASPTYLLEAGIEVLHQQSREWLSDIAFWKDETAFFYALLVKRTIPTLPSGTKDKAEIIEGELSRITESELTGLEQEVELHEYYLNQLLESKKQNQEPFREKHKVLSGKFTDFEQRYKRLKKEIFGLIVTH